MPGSADPVAAFDAADLAAQRSVIDAVCSVSLLHHPRGVGKFDPETVRIEWR
jgi:site-specific DNA recombinase